MGTIEQRDEQVGDLNLSQHLPFQERMWVAQRVGWALGTLLLLAALLGVFGRGPISRTIVGQEGSAMWLEFDRFSHLKGSATLAIHLGPTVGSSAEKTISIPRDYLDKMHVSRIVPEPTEVRASEGVLVYTFKTVQPQQGLEIGFQMTPAEFGVISGRVEVPDGSTLEFWHFIYP